MFINFSDLTGTDAVSETWIFVDYPVINDMDYTSNLLILEYCDKNFYEWSECVLIGPPLWRRIFFLEKKSDSNRSTQISLN